MHNAIIINGTTKAFYFNSLILINIMYQIILAPFLK
jgi:hypothetical protein